VHCFTTKDHRTFAIRISCPIFQVGVHNSYFFKFFENKKVFFLQQAQLVDVAIAPATAAKDVHRCVAVEVTICYAKNESNGVFVNFIGVVMLNAKNVKSKNGSVFVIENI
jgi:hypothetical protein